MGVVDWGKPKFRVAHRFHLPYSSLHSNYHHIKMKSFIVLICVGMAIAGDDMFGHEKMKKQWTDYKAMDSCFARKCRRSRTNEDDEGLPTTQPRSSTIQQPTSTNSTCSWTNSTTATRQHVQENDDENDDEEMV